MDSIKISKILPCIETISPQSAFKELGVAIVRGALNRETTQNTLTTWARFQDSHEIRNRSINKYNPVDFQIAAPDSITNLYRHPDILDIVEKWIGPDIGLYSSKLLVKDQYAPGEVFLHQDHAYQHGLPGKITVFLAITDSSPQKGAMIFYPGTQLFGDLGDAGEIDASVLPPDWPIYQPSLAPGDAVIMNPYVWHASPANRTAEPRVILGSTYQPASDYSSIEIVRGEGDNQANFMNSGDRQKAFVRSRTSKIKELQAIADKAKS